MSHLGILVLSFAGGILPALFWLWFWLREDRIHPEPRGLIALSFIGGMLALILALFTEKFLLIYFALPLAILVSFCAPVIEELVKYVSAHFLALERAEDDEPVDPVIYMLTTALGFSALENVIFLFDSIGTDGIVSGVVTGNLRFLGATLLHLITSATVGLFIGFSFYDRPWLKRIALIAGLITATILHMLFNYFILNGTGTHVFITFIVVWSSIVILLLAFERVKRVHPAFKRKSR
ncbi:MAG: PrsW family glutamic-type intramembrane protease [Candidatus Paceibacterota bacterium]|jgi:RsiW-degrading membrane proteinase PrsW (M82 family)